jgi:hypothetical protein
LGWKNPFKGFSFETHVVGWGRSHRVDPKPGLRRKAALNWRALMVPPASSSPSHFSGDLRIYSCPRALVRHIQWSLNQIFDYPVSLDWAPQPLVAGALATTFEWRGFKPVASTLASTLKSWHYLRFEVREFPTGGGEGTLYRCTPGLGLHQATTGSSGDVMIHENRIMTAMQAHRSYESLREAIAVTLGTAWDEELECYRLAVEAGGDDYRATMTI